MDELLAAAQLVTVQLERTSEQDSVGGAIYSGWAFSAAAGDDVVTVRFSDGYDRGDLPEVFGLGQAGLPLWWVTTVLPALVAVVCDPRVAAARQRWADGLPAVDADTHRPG